MKMRSGGWFLNSLMTHSALSLSTLRLAVDQAFFGGGRTVAPQMSKRNERAPSFECAYSLARRADA